MARFEEPITIKRYGNGRLHNASVGSYVSRQDIADLAGGDDVFVVRDARSGEDVTTIMPKQIIAERIHHG